MGDVLKNAMNQTYYHLDLLVPRLMTLREHSFYPRTILDIGAYQGDWTSQVQNIWPEANYFMVEANIEQENALASVPNAKYEIALLGDKKKSVVEYFATPAEITSGNSIYQEQTGLFDNAPVKLLSMITLDSLVKKNKIKNIDFIKIDTQGSELDILEGATTVIKQAQFILLETQNLEFNKGAPLLDEVITKMKKWGFRVFDITEIHYLPTGEMIQIDFLFVNKNSRYLKKGLLL